MKSQTLLINGLRQRIYLWGNEKRPPLFLFHGWLDTGAGFEFLCADLKDKFFCIAPDLRGYGKSQHSPNPLGYFFYEYVADIHELLGRLSPRRPANILGHSLGGAAASVYAGTFPHRVRKFINVEGFAFGQTQASQGPQRLRRWIKGIHTTSFPVHQDNEHLAKRLKSANRRLPLERAQFLARHQSRPAPGGVMMSADPKHKMVEPFWFPLQVFEAFWKNISARCLCVLAEKSEMRNYFRWKNFDREIRARLRLFPRGTKKVVIKDCGHMVHHERPAELAREIHKFLEV